MSWAGKAMKTTSPIKANTIRPTVAMIGQKLRDGSVVRLSSFAELEEESLSWVIGDMERFYITAGFRQTFSSCRVVGISVTVGPDRFRPPSPHAIGSMPI